MATLFLAGTMLAGPVTPVLAQDVKPPLIRTTEAPVPAEATIKSITVSGNQRLEAETILSYLRLRVGQVYNRAVLDQALKDLAATELFKDYEIADDKGALTI